MDFEAEDTREIINYFPNIEGQQILELAAGIGRFTKPLAAVAEHIVVVDFVEKFIAKNKENNCKFNNITYHVSNAMDINFERESFDFVLSNWLFMYLENDECQLLLAYIAKWLKSEGYFFIRESCISASDPSAPHPHSYYRKPEFYVRLFEKQFTVIANGNVAVYEKQHGNKNQLWWLLQKRVL